MSICCRTLRRGGLAIVPCDTIYGILGAAPAAEARIRRTKSRAEDRPLLVLIPDRSWLWRCGVADVPSEQLLCLWPGALTIVFPRAGGGTVGVRLPDDPFLCQLARCVGAPLYSTSVNRSGLPSLSCVSQIKAAFGRSVDLIVDGGELYSPVPSTVVDVTARPFRLLRPGAVDVSTEMLTVP
jgi:L-threonylcarbamoyladenylate synthase